LEAVATADLDDLRAGFEQIADGFEFIAADTLEQIRHRD
jgi:hypothetical protein